MKDKPVWDKNARAEVRKQTGLCVWDLEQLAIKLPTPEDFGATILLLSRYWGGSFMHSLRQHVKSNLDDFIEGRAAYPTLLSVDQISSVLEFREKEIAKYDGLYDRLRKNVWRNQPRPRMKHRQWVAYQERLQFERMNAERK